MKLQLKIVKKRMARNRRVTIGKSGCSEKTMTNRPLEPSAVLRWVQIVCIPLAYPLCVFCMAARASARAIGRLKAVAALCAATLQGVPGQRNYPG